MILAAGLGTRLRPITDTLPKPAVPFLNVPILAFPYQMLSQISITDLAVNTHHLPDKLQALFKKSSLKKWPVQFFNESPKILGSGGGVKNIEKFLFGPNGFVVVNGDGTVVDFDVHEIEKLQKKHEAGKAIATLLVIQHPEVGRSFGGVWVDSSGKVVSVGKQRPAGAVHGYHYVSLAMFRTEIFEFLPEGISELWDAVNAALAKGHSVDTHLITGTWLETGNAADFLRATKYLVDRLDLLKPGNMAFEVISNHWESFKDRPHRRIGIDSIHPWGSNPPKGVLVGNRCKIPSTTVIAGFAVFGDGCVIGENVKIENSVILEKANVDHGTVLKNQIYL